MTFGDLLAFCEENGVSIIISHDGYSNSPLIKLEGSGPDYHSFALRVPKRCIEQAQDKEEYLKGVLYFIKKKLDEQRGKKHDAE